MFEKLILNTVQCHPKLAIVAQYHYINAVCKTSVTFVWHLIAFHSPNLCMWSVSRIPSLHLFCELVSHTYMCRVLTAIFFGSGHWSTPVNTMVLKKSWQLEFDSVTKEVQCKSFRRPNASKVWQCFK